MPTHTADILIGLNNTASRPVSHCQLYNMPACLEQDCSISTQGQYMRGLPAAEAEFLKGTAAASCVASDER